MFNCLSPENEDGSLVSYFKLVLGYAKVHEQEQNFIRGREKSDRGREVGLEGEGSGGRGGGKRGERGREVGIGYPLSTPSYFISNVSKISRFQENATNYKNVHSYNNHDKKYVHKCEAQTSQLSFRD